MKELNVSPAEITQFQQQYLNTVQIFNNKNMKSTNARNKVAASSNDDEEYHLSAAEL
jgi:hypothetical protein